MRKKLKELFSSNNLDDIKLATRILCKEYPDLCKYSERSIKSWRESGRHTYWSIPPQLARKLSGSISIDFEIFYNSIREIINEEFYNGKLDSIQEKGAYE